MTTPENTNTIDSIIEALQARNSTMSDKLFSESFGNAFLRDVLNLCPELIDRVSGSTQKGIAVTKLAGFSDYVSENDLVCRSRISASMVLCEDIEITLNSEVSYSKCGDGAEVDSWTLLVNGDDIEDLFELSDKFESAMNFFIDTYYEGNDYDSTVSALSQKQIDDIATVIGL